MITFEANLRVVPSGYEAGDVCMVYEQQISGISSLESLTLGIASLRVVIFGPITRFAYGAKLTAKYLYRHSAGKT
jgi:hypothetical protein